MTNYSFEIQKCITVVIDAENKEKARMKIINNLDDYANEMISDCYVSDGVKQ